MVASWYPKLGYFQDAWLTICLTARKLRKLKSEETHLEGEDWEMPLEVGGRLILNNQASTSQIMRT